MYTSMSVSHQRRLFLLVLVLRLCAAALAAELRYVISLPVSLSGPDGDSTTAIADITRLALEDVNKRVAGPNGHNVTLTLLDSGSTKAQAVTTVFDAQQKNNAIAVIGEWTSGATQPMALAAQNLGMYFCSGAATSTSLSDKASFPLLFRTIPSDASQGIALARFVKAMGWSSCSILASSSAYGRSIADSFLATAEQLQVSVATTQVINFEQLTADNTAASKGLKLPIDTIAEAGARIVLFFGEPKEFAMAAPVAFGSKIIGADWVWIGSEALSGIADTVDNEALVRGFLHIFPTEFENAADTKSILGRYQRSKPGATRLEPYSGFHIDCVYALTHMFVEMIKSGTSDSSVTGRGARVPLSRALKPFDGISGRVAFDSNGDRRASYRMLSIWDKKATPVYEIGTEGEIKELQAPRFFSGSTDRPQDRPDSLVMYLRFSRFGAWLVCAIVAAFILAVIVTTAMVLRQWNSRIVKAYGPGVLICIAVGLSLVLGSTVSWIDIQTRLSCNISLWGIALGYELIVVPLLYRTYYTWTTFENTILRRNSVRSTLVRALPFVGLFVVQPIILGLWMLFAPIQPRPVATISSFSYTCRSSDVLTHNLFKWITITWNVLLLSALLYLTNSTRYLQVTGRAPRYAHFVATNLAFSMAILSPLAAFFFPEFSLGSYWVHMAVVLYACTFTLGMTQVRVLQLLHKPDDGGRDATIAGHLSRPLGGAKGTQTSTTTTTYSTVNADLTAVSGKPSSFLGEFPVKFPGALATWQMHRIVIALSEGYMGVTRVFGDSNMVGQVWAIKHVVAVPSRDLEMVVDVHATGKVAMMVQFRTQEQVDRFLQMVSATGRGHHHHVGYRQNASGAMNV